jgi:hypothetical protein
MSAFEGAISRRLFSLCGLGALSTVGLAACELPTIEKYKITIFATVSGRVISSAGVWKIKSQDQIAFPNQSLRTSDLSGDAVPLDLGRGRVIFLTLYGYQGAFPNNLYDAPLAPWTSSGPMRSPRARLEPGAPLTLTPYETPAIVSFGNRADPETGFIVDPRTPSKTLGSDIQKIWVTLEFADGPVTRVIDRWLPWIPGRKRAEKFGSIDWKRGKFTLYAAYFTE